MGLSPHSYNLFCFRIPPLYCSDAYDLFLPSSFTRCVLDHLITSFYNLRSCLIPCRFGIRRTHTFRQFGKFHCIFAHLLPELLLFFFYFWFFHSPCVQLPTAHFYWLPSLDSLSISGDDLWFPHSLRTRVLPCPCYFHALIPCCQEQSCLSSPLHFLVHVHSVGGRGMGGKRLAHSLVEFQSTAEKSSVYQCRA